MLLQGLFVPLTCPFYRDGASYLRKLEANLARYSLGPAAGLVALLPNGEAAALTDAEVHAFLKVVGETAVKEKLLLAGVERASVAAVLGMTDIAAEAGFDGIVLAPPPDWARLVHHRDARELLAFYQTIADGSALPLVLWSDSAPPSLRLPVELVAELAAHPNIHGMIEVDLTPERAADVLAQTQHVRREVTVTPIFAAVTRRMRQVAAPVPTLSPGFVAAGALASGASVSTATVAPPVPTPELKTRTRQVSFQLLSAAPAYTMAAVLGAGAAGAVPDFAACAPQACFEAYIAWKEGNYPLADERAGRLRDAEELLRLLGPAALKTACDFNGYYGGMPRLPRLPLLAADRAAVEKALLTIRS